MDQSWTVPYGSFAGSRIRAYTECVAARRAFRTGSAGLALIVLLPACGTRMSEQAVTAGVAGGQVSLTPESINELAAAVARGERSVRSRPPVNRVPEEQVRASTPSVLLGQRPAATALATSAA